MHPSSGAGRWLHQPLPADAGACSSRSSRRSCACRGAVAATSAFPTRALLRSPPQSLEVVLVNSKSATRPDKADALAQANLDGGGNTDENRRAKTPLPGDRAEAERGDDAEARAPERAGPRGRSSASCSTQARRRRRRRSASPPSRTPAPEPAEAERARIWRARALAIARLEAQIARQLEEYQQAAAQGKFVGARAAEYRFAQYVEDWRAEDRAHRHAQLPGRAARGQDLRQPAAHRLHQPDGSVDGVEIDRSSGLQGPRRRRAQDHPHARRPSRRSRRTSAGYRPLGDHPHLDLRPRRQAVDN